VATTQYVKEHLDDLIMGLEIGRNWFGWQKHDVFLWSPNMKLPIQDNTISYS
jgi:hypothetical protein